MNKIQPVVLCAGNDVRLWPEFREQKAQQFVALLGSEPCLAASLQCIAELPEHLPPLFVCSVSNEVMLSEQLQTLAIGEFSIIVVPEQQNDTLAIYLATHWVQALYPDATMVVLSAGHYVTEPHLFACALSQAAASAALGGVVCLGINMALASSGYGFIKKGKVKLVSMEIDGFVDQLDLAASDDYVGNSGVFVAVSNVLLREYQTLAPEIVQHGQSIFDNMIKLANIHYLAGDGDIGFTIAPFHKAILAKTQRAEVIA